MKIFRKRNNQILFRDAIASMEVLQKEINQCKNYQKRYMLFFCLAGYTASILLHRGVLSPILTLIAFFLFVAVVAKSISNDNRLDLLCALFALLDVNGGIDIETEEGGNSTKVSLKPTS